MIQEAQVNLAYKWFIGVNPEDALPDASQLSRFRNHRLGVNQVADVLKQVVGQCIDKGLIKSKTIIMDATHTHAATQRQQPLNVLREAAKRLFRVVVKRHPKLEKKLPPLPKVKSEQEDAEKVMLRYLAELGQTVEELLPDHEGAISDKLHIAKEIVEDERLLANKGIRSAVDPDARFGWKSRTKSFFGYKEHLAMTEEEFITAVEVTPGTSDDGKQLTTLLAQTKVNGIVVEEIIADTAYSIRIIAEHFKEQMEFELSDTFNERIKRRPIIERMKRFHGMERAKYRGLFRMRIQAYLTAFVVNVKRMVRLIEQKQPAL